MNAETFNSRYPVGTPVFAYPGVRPEDIPSATRLVTRTRTKAQTSASGDPVVWVEGEGAYICLTHVDVVSEAEYEAAKLADAVAAQGALPMPVGAEPKQRTILDRSRAALRARMAKDDLRLVLENVIAYAADLEAEHDKLVRWHLEDGQSLDRLQHMVAGLKDQQEKDDAEYAAVIAERDSARKALREACDQIAALESDLGGATARIAELTAERHTTNEALDDAVRELRRRDLLHTQTAEEAL